jgi:hypothetical protein
MTATIELTGEEVRPGDSSYEAAPALARKSQISRAAESGIGSQDVVSHPLQNTPIHTGTMAHKIGNIRTRCRFDPHLTQGKRKLFPLLRRPNLPNFPLYEQYHMIFVC